MIGKTLLVLAFWIVVTGPVLAQGLADLAQLAVQVSENRAENSKKMREYSWKRRTEMSAGGEVQATKLELVRFDIDGRKQTTTISEQKPDQRRKRGIRGRIQQRQGEAKKEWIKELQGLLQKYSLSSTGQVLDFLESATFSPGSAPGTIQILGKNVVQPGDQLEMVINSETKNVLTTKVSTRLDEDPVLMDINHARLSSGLNYQARTVIQVPSKKVRMTVENFDFNRQ